VRRGAHHVASLRVVLDEVNVTNQVERGLRLGRVGKCIE
jgi:hypothetical protein